MATLAKLFVRQKFPLPRQQVHETAEMRGERKAATPPAFPGHRRNPSERGADWSIWITPAADWSVDA